LQLQRHATLEASDTGTRISSDIQQVRFDPFYTTSFTGRDLGPAPTLGFVRSHGVTVRVESKVDGGTTFSILFPPSSARLEPVSEADSRSTRVEPGGATVLVIDDEAVVRDVTRAMLQSAGYNVVVARDGVETIDLFERDSERIDLVLLDVAMPGMDGREAYEGLCRIREDVLVVLSSGYTEEEVISQFGTKGVVDFVHKPYKLGTLLQTVQRALAEGRPG
jgi:CheY-like chemotaxis protein